MHQEESVTQSQRLFVFVGQVLLVAAAASLAYWPALRAFLQTDDYTLLAFSRILRHPLALFSHEHFPLGPYFRPLPMLLWWISARIFGNALMPQYALNLLLHVGVSLLLWRLLKRVSPGSHAGWMIALLFAVHPAAVGTALWLSDRFDLLATLFALLALDAAFACRQSPSRLRTISTFALVLCALLSKESGVVAAAAVLVVWLWPRRSGADERLGPAQPAAAAMLTAALVAWVGWRAYVAHAVLSMMVDGAASPVALIGAGSIRWIVDFWTYALAWRQMHAVALVAFACGVVLLAAAAAAARFWRVPRPLPHSKAAALACSAAIVAVCLVMEAPYSYLWTVTPGLANPDLAAQYSRLFYLPLCGVAIAAVVAVERIAQCCAESMRRPALLLAGSAAVLLACAWATAAHDLADGYRRKTLAHRPVVAAAIEAVAAAELPSSHCRLFLIGVGMRDSGYMLKAMPDAVIKALARDERRVEHCLIQTEQTSWENLVGGARLTPERALPMRPLQGRDGSVPWIDVGGLQIVYLNLFPDIDARCLADAVFLRRNGARFEDATAAVRDGSISVRFVCARPAAQCRP